MCLCFLVCDFWKNFFLLNLTQSTCYCVSFATTDSSVGQIWSFKTGENHEAGYQPLLWCRFNLDGFNIFLSSSADVFLVIFVTEKWARHFSPDGSISLRSAQGWGHPTVQNFLLRRHALFLPYPFDALQISFQQAVQRKSDDVVHVLKLEEGETRVERLCWII